MDVVVVLRVTIVETDISLMELDCHCFMVVAGIFCLVELDCLMLVSLSVVVLRELTYVVTLMLTHQLLVSIAVIFQLVLSMMMMTTQ